MAQAAKFMFDRDLETPDAAAEPPEAVAERRLREEFERRLEEERAQAYQQGIREGEEKARTSLEAKADAALEQLVGCANAILSGLGEECEAIRAEALRTALAASECLAGELVRREPAALIEGLFSDCLEHLSNAPHIVVRVHDSLAEQLQEKASAAAAQKGFAGRIIVLGDPETQRGDCGIEWADGGIFRNSETLRKDVARVVKRHMANRNPDMAVPDAEQEAADAAETPEAHETTETPEKAETPDEIIIFGEPKTLTPVAAQPRTNGSGDTE